MFSKTIVVGHLGRDPEQRYTSGGQPVTNFSVATTRTWNDAHGEHQEKTTWFKVTAWGKLGELCAQYLTKGRLVLVEGEVDASAWNTQDGTAKASLDLTARNVRFLGGKGDGSNGGSHREQTNLDGSAPYIDEEEIPF